MNRWVAIIMLGLTSAIVRAEPLKLPPGKDVLDRYEARTYDNGAGGLLSYRLFKPDKYDPQTRYPLVLFLHGAGGRGSDNKGQILDGGTTATSWAAPEFQAKRPCFILAPQCPNDKRWVEVDWSADTHALPRDPSISLQMTLEVLNRLMTEFSIDPQRIYITGLSMGGFGTWDLIARQPYLFAAAVPVCGGGDELKVEGFKDLPIWAFHGGNDTVVKTQRTRNMIRAIQKAGGRPKYTEYPGVGHDSWLKAYADSEMVEWLFSQQRPAAGGGFRRLPERR